MTIPAGTRLGRYEVRQPLGAGGMGEVYLGWDPDLERPVAVKVLRSDRDENPDRVRRFVQEARAASALNHPNVAHVYEVGSENGLRFIAMEVVEGETLRDRIRRGPMSIDDVLSIANQVVAGVAAAHQAGIVHRDLKPENVIVRPDGYVKVLDFGLAKLLQSRDQDSETLLRTGSGVMLGTLHYMAPEQFGGADVTAAADVFSLGIVLFEMVTGRRPFEGDNATEVATAILSKPPSSATALRAETPPHLSAVIAKALQKDPLQRYSTAGELLEELKQISRETTVDALAAERARSAAPVRRRWMIAAAAVVILAAAVFVFLRYRRSQQIHAATLETAKAERLLNEGRFPEAFASASAAAGVLRGDRRVQSVIDTASTRASIESDPPGAAVYLQRFKGPPDRVRAGTTPLIIEHLPRAEYVLTLEKKGFAPVKRIFSALYPRDFQLPHIPPVVKIKLVETSKTPEGMIFVEGSPFRLTGWSRSSDREVALSDYFIDRHEVSNREFEEFVRAGGYRMRELWRHPFEENGRTIPFEAAAARFHDTTGLPGPRGWVGGAPPAGREDHPVTNVTWYEAAAFAQWKKKMLPTVYEWEYAARPRPAGAMGTAFPWGMVVDSCSLAICGAGGTDVSERTNFLGKGTLPVDSMPFGMSVWGAYHMAGNVAEWCVNRSESGFAARGGGWNNGVYAFGRTASLPPWYTSDDLGFRCARAVGAAGDQGAFDLNPSLEIPEYKPVDDRAFEQIRRRYDYARTPPQVRTVEVVETPSWRREKLTYVSDGKTIPAYLYIPKGFKPPYQVIHFAPAGDVASGYRPLPASIEAQLPPYIRGGRAVFSVVMEGFIDRPRIRPTNFDSRDPEYVDFVVTQVTELRRGLDVLETRKDLDATRIAFLAPSAGSWAGLVLAGLESRYRSVTFVGTHVRPSEITTAPAASRINFAPRISAPKMMLQGRYDESAPLATHAEPLFKLLREPKRLEVFEGSHMPLAEVGVPLVMRWLDETMGPVRQ